MVLSFGAPIERRTDGIQEAGLERPQDGREYPLIDWTTVHVAGAGAVGVACPDCFAVSGGGREVALTLVRSPVFAWHDPAELERDRRYRYTDQGEHRYRFTVRTDAGSGADALGRLSATDALAFHRPPACFDWTKGMQP